MPTTQFPAQLSLFDSLLSGLIGRGPAPGEQLGETAQGPTVVEFADDVEQVALGVDPEQGA